MKKECLFGHSFALLEQCEAVILSLLLYHKALAFNGKGTDLPCAAGGGILEMEMRLFLSKERNRVQ